MLLKYYIALTIYLWSPVLNWNMSFPVWRLIQRQNSHLAINIHSFYTNVCIYLKFLNIQIICPSISFWSQNHIEYLKVQVSGPHSDILNLTLGFKYLLVSQLCWWFWALPKLSLPCCRILTGYLTPRGPHLHALVLLFWKILALSTDRFRSEQALEANCPPPHCPKHILSLGGDNMFCSKCKYFWAG